MFDCPEDAPRLPALTRAEADALDNYLAVLDYLGRINPARTELTYRAMIAAQGLVARAVALRDALALMWEREETELDTTTFVRALRYLDAPSRIDRIRVPD